MRSGFAHWPSRLASLGLIGLLGVVCAHWFWLFAAPRTAAPPATAEAVGPRALDSILHAKLFGTTSVSQPVAQAAAATDLVLRGISSTRRGAMAVIAIDKGKTVAVTTGDEVLPGVKLDKVFPDHVIVSRGGVPQRLDLPQRKPTDAPPTRSGANPPAKK